MYERKFASLIFEKEVIAVDSEENVLFSEM
jgi:hypothetical protein